MIDIWNPALGEHRVWWNSEKKGQVWAKAILHDRDTEKYVEGEGQELREVMFKMNFERRTLKDILFDLLKMKY